MVDDRGNESSTGSLEDKGALTNTRRTEEMEGMWQSIHHRGFNSSHSKSKNRRTVFSEAHYEGAYSTRCYKSGHLAVVEPIVS